MGLKVGGRSPNPATAKPGSGPLRSARLRRRMSINALARAAAVGRNTILRAEQRGGWPTLPAQRQAVRTALGLTEKAAS